MCLIHTVPASPSPTPCGCHNKPHVPTVSYVPVVTPEPVTPSPIPVTPSPIPVTPTHPPVHHMCRYKFCNGETKAVKPNVLMERSLSTSLSGRPTDSSRNSTPPSSKLLRSQTANTPASVIKRCNRTRASSCRRRIVGCFHSRLSRSSTSMEMPRRSTPMTLMIASSSVLLCNSLL